jgi:hypothetical protein
MGGRARRWRLLTGGANGDGELATAGWAGRAGGDRRGGSGQAAIGEAARGAAGRRRRASGRRD